jgi:hypothetical protein
VTIYLSTPKILLEIEGEKYVNNVNLQMTFTGDKNYGFPNETGHSLFNAARQCTAASAGK